MRVSDLLSRWQELRSRGQEVSPEEVCAEHPELLDELRRQVEALRRHEVASFSSAPVTRVGAETSPSLDGDASIAPDLAVLAIPGYEVLKILGRGGMGVVFKARQMSLKRIVALKRIRAGTDARPEDLARFRAEAESVARLQHPNIVQIYEVGEQGGLPFFSLEYVEGGSLDRRLAGTPQLAATAARLVETIARAVHIAHLQGVVHRDLKPANVLLAGGPNAPLEQCVPKVTDFGLAKRLDEDSAQTASGAILGTPNYMAPEQAQGRTREVGPLADVWALGAILYECLTGQPPFRAATVMDTLMQVIRDEPVPPRKVNRKVPRDLETICLKCLHKDPRRRYGSAEQLADDLHRFLNFEPIRARRVGFAERGWRWVRRRPAPFLAGLLLVLLLAGAGFGYRLWRQATQSAGPPGLDVEYYDVVLWPDEDPQGVGRLSEVEALRRPRAFKLYRRGDAVERVDVLGGQGRLLRHNPFHLLANGGVPTTTPLREASYHFVRDEEGRVTEVAAHDGRDHVLWSLNHSTPSRMRYAERAGPWREAPAEPALFELVRNDSGAVREVWHVDAEGRRTPARRGVHGLRVEAGSEGEVRLTLLEHSGKPTRPVACWALRSSEAARQTEEAYFDAAGKPVAGAEGCPRWVWSQEGPQALRGAGLDAEGRPMRTSDGSHSCLRHFDGQGGNCLAEVYFGLDGMPCLIKQGIHRLTARYDERGNQVEEAYFGLDGRPAARVDEGPLKGFAKLTWQYDGTGKLREIGYFVLNDKGSCALRRRADAADHTLEEAYFTSEGRATLHEGVHRATARYDERGNLVEKAYFGLDGRPAARVGEGSKGCAKTTWEYDSAGALRECCDFVPDGKGGYALSRRADAAYRTLEEAYFTPEGRPTLSDSGNHRWTARYDERGKQIEEASFGLDGKPCLHKEGYHRFTKRYDERGNQLEEAYFGLDGRPTACVDGFQKGCAKLTWEYDSKGKLRQHCYFVLDSKGGYALRRRDDAAYHTVEEAHFTPEGRPTLSKEGYHRCTNRYDERGNWVEVAYFGLDGRPTVCVDGVSKGYAKLTWEFDRKGKMCERCYFVPDGKGGYALCRRADADAHTLEEAHFTPEGRPSLSKEGNHRWTGRYDERGKQVEGANFGLDGKPCLHNNGMHRWTGRYDERGQQVEEAYFGLDGKPVARVDEGSLKGCAKLTWEYDGKGKLRQRCYFVPDSKGGCALRRRADSADRTLEEVSFTPEGRPNLNEHGVHRATVRYDERGNRIEVACFGLDGKPCLHNDGMQRWTGRYDERGKQLEVAYFGLDGRPAARVDEGPFKGCAKLTWEYDSKGKLRQRCYFVPDGKGGYAMQRRADAADHTLEEAYFTSEGRATLAEGVHRATARYDERGNLAEVALFGLDGKSCLHQDGYHRFTARYDERGRRVDTTPFDVAGKRLRWRILVKEVSPESLAAKAGLREGDVLLRYDSKELTSDAHFRYLRDEEGKGGPPRKLELLRKSKTVTVDLAPGYAGITLLNKAVPPSKSR